MYKKIANLIFLHYCIHWSERNGDEVLDENDRNKINVRVE